jgi:hypothetical protein
MSAVFEIVLLVVILASLVAIIKWWEGPEIPRA